MTHYVIIYNTTNFIVECCTSNRSAIERALIAKRNKEGFIRLTKDQEQVSYLQTKWVNIQTSINSKTTSRIPNEPINHTII